jgi:hypothetical protein
MRTSIVRLATVAAVLVLSPFVLWLVLAMTSGDGCAGLLSVIEGCLPR